MVCSTINKMGSVLKILVGHPQDLPEPRVSCPDVQRLHILGPGLQQVASSRMEVGQCMAYSTINKIGVVL